MDKQNDLPKRKHPRLKNFDYSSVGAYFVTICTQDKRCSLSHIVWQGFSVENAAPSTTVGRGLAPAEKSGIEYTVFGKIAEKQLFLLEERFPHLSIDQYVIMPNHIHVIFILKNETAGASPRPTLMDIVCAYKSLTTRECKKNGFVGKLFQNSFHEHVIRTREEYEEICKYIHENPMRWHFDELYSE